MLLSGRRAPDCSLLSHSGSGLLNLSIIIDYFKHYAGRPTADKWVQRNCPLCARRERTLGDNCSMSALCQVRTPQLSPFLTGGSRLCRDYKGTDRSLCWSTPARPAFSLRAEPERLPLPAATTPKPSSRKCGFRTAERGIVAVTRRTSKSAGSNLRRTNLVFGGDRFSTPSLRLAFYALATSAFVSPNVHKKKPPGAGEFRGNSLISVCRPKSLLFFSSTLFALLAALSGLLVLLARHWLLALLLLTTLRVIALLLLSLFQLLFFLPVHWLPPTCFPRS